MTAALDWESDARDWPNRAASRFIHVGGIGWHVQRMGEGPDLLLHGTGAATHSWRDLMPLLARHFTVIAADLPGHGFTDRPARFSLEGIARATTGLLNALDARPGLAAGHSAGAAILVRMCLDGGIAPRALVSLNGALLALRGAPAHLFAPLARLLAVNPLVPLLFAWRAADRGVVERMIRDTGSTLDRAGMTLYARLAQRPGHVAGALAMMAGWDLRRLERDLPRLATRLVLVVGENDRTVPPAEAQRVQALVPGAELVRLPGLGHLAHEERPDAVAALLLRLAGECGLVPAA